MFRKQLYLLATAARLFSGGDRWTLGRVAWREVGDHPWLEPLAD